MRILALHNSYLEPGGEDAVFRAETELLVREGHEVTRLEVNNAQLSEMSRVETTMGSIYSRRWHHNVKAALSEDNFDVVHVHNFFPVISPSIYYACRDARMPVVQTLHNYRLVCPSANLLRNGLPCEDCIGKAIAWPGVLHSCYRKSRLQSLGVASMVAAHKALKSWRELVTVYIALTQFAKQKFVQGGLPQKKIVVKPNFIHPDPGVGPEPRGDFALFVGRLSSEKGVTTLLEAWGRLPDIELKVVGAGPLLNRAKQHLESLNLTDSVEMLGRLTNRQAIELMREAKVLVFPSETYEGFPVTLAEAMACGTPVVGSRIGSVAEIVGDHRTGVLFEPGNPVDLAEKVRECFDRPEDLARMSVACRAEFNDKYTAKRNLEMLTSIYEKAIREVHSAASPVD